MWLFAKPEEIILTDNNVRNGAMAHYLLKGLKGRADKDGNKTITLGELYNYVQKKLDKHSHHMHHINLVGTFFPSLPVLKIK